MCAEGDENTHPNSIRNQNVKKEIQVFKNAFSPDVIKYSSSKRYQDHFTESEKQEDSSDEDDYLYDACNDEYRPSKDVTTINTGMTTMRDDFRAGHGEISDEFSSRSVRHPQYTLVNNNSKSSKEFGKQYLNIEVKPQLNKKYTEARSSPHFPKLIPKEEENIEEIASMILIDISSQKNSEKTRK